jgi:hypothetical protein
MAITIEIGERSFAVPPFMLAELELAAPHIDRMNELRKEFQLASNEGRDPSAVLAFQMTRELVEILAIGIANVDPDVTADSISKTVNFTFMDSLQRAVDELLKSSGLSAGEAKAPSPRRGKGAKVSRSR